MTNTAPQMTEERRERLRLLCLRATALTEDANIYCVEGKGHAVSPQGYRLIAHELLHRANDLKMIAAKIDQALAGALPPD